MTGHRALEKKQITQGNNRKVQNPSGSPEELLRLLFFIKKDKRHRLISYFLQLHHFFLIFLCILEKEH